MPGHDRGEGVRHSRLQTTSSDTDQAPTAAWQTPIRHLGFRQASALSACARTTSYLSTATSQAHSPLRGRMRTHAHGRGAFRRGRAHRQID